MDLSKTKKITKYIVSFLFFKMKEWEFLRSSTLKRYGYRCMRCGATKCELHVDHIKPRKKFPKHQFNPENLQVLCRDCNMKKGCKDTTDYRPKQNENTNYNRPAFNGTNHPSPIRTTRTQTD